MGKCSSGDHHQLAGTEEHSPREGMRIIHNAADPRAAVSRGEGGVVEGNPREYLLKPSKPHQYSEGVPWEPER